MLQQQRNAAGVIMMLVTEKYALSDKELETAERTCELNTKGTSEWTWSLSNCPNSLIGLENIVSYISVSHISVVRPKRWIFNF